METRSSRNYYDIGRNKQSVVNSGRNLEDEGCGRCSMNYATNIFQGEPLFQLDLLQNFFVRDLVLAISRVLPKEAVY
jgi:hypothetical protein